jgi:hypothetical protein
MADAPVFGVLNHSSPRGGESTKPFSWRIDEESDSLMAGKLNSVTGPLPNSIPAKFAQAYEESERLAAVSFFSECAPCDDYRSITRHMR